VDKSKFDPDIVRRGSVARHVSNGREHMSIILRVRANGNAPCLFFTSNPNWKRVSNRRYRRATDEEIKLAGMITSKETYLTSAVRHSSEFLPIGVEFPDHRLESLYKEFFPDASDT
jgi:hypothetical protein